mmetsp:Transcript_9296/g.30212  ORF Transcript_9296/g.30212 Transcript_9296/m.30212 type:complete len:1301 (+) Transcript_9296:94-3996(+)
MGVTFRRCPRRKRSRRRSSESEELSRKACRVRGEVAEPPPRDIWLLARQQPWVLEDVAPQDQPRRIWRRLPRDERRETSAHVSHDEERDPDNEKRIVKPFRVRGPYVGSWITRSVIDDGGLVGSLSVGKVVGYLGKEESDYLDEESEPCALWHVEYVSGELKGDAEDLEEWEVLASAPRSTREQSPDACADALAAGGRRLTRLETLDAAAIVTSSAINAINHIVMPTTGPAATASLADTTQAAAREEEPTTTNTAEHHSKNPQESDYERLRRERIEANERFLKQLGLSSKKERNDAATKRKRTSANVAAGAVDELELRRSARSCVLTTEACRYSEDRVFKSAIDEAKDVSQMVVQKRHGPRLVKDRLRRWEPHDQKPGEKHLHEVGGRETALAHETVLLRRKCLVVERELSRASSASDRSAARSLAKPLWLSNVGTDWNPNAKRTLYNDIQVGDRFIYFVDGHAAYLKRRKLMLDDRVIPWFLLNAPAGEFRVLDCVVTQALPCFPDIATYVKEKLKVLLDKGTKQKFAFFADAVDIGAYPDYPRVVEMPMDFSKIASTNYQSLEHFKNDVLLVFDNALKFNMDGSSVALAAQELKRIFIEDMEKDQAGHVEIFATGPRRKLMNDDLSDDAKTRYHGSAARKTPQRLLVRLVPTYYLHKSRFEDLRLDGDRDLMSKSPEMIGYVQPDGSFALVGPFSMWLTDDVDFLIPRQLVVERTNMLLQCKPSIVDVEDKKYTLRCVKGANNLNSSEEKLSNCGMPRWNGVKLTKVGSSSSKAVFRNVWDVKVVAPPQETPCTDSDDDIITLTSRSSWRSLTQHKVVSSRRSLRQPSPDDDASDSWTLTTIFPVFMDDPLKWQFPNVTPSEASKSLLKVIDAVRTVSALTQPYFHDYDANNGSYSQSPIMKSDNWLYMRSITVPENSLAEEDDATAHGFRRKTKSSSGNYMDDDDDDLGSTDHSDTGTDPNINVKEDQNEPPRKLALETTFDEVYDKLRRCVYRRPSALFDDVRRIYLAEACGMLTHSAVWLTPGAEKRIFGAKLAAQMCIALCANELASHGARVHFTSCSPWQSFIRQTVGNTSNMGLKIRENCNLAISAARRDLSHDAVLVRAVVAELRLALLKCHGNATGTCRETALKVLDIYGGWHLGADTQRAQEAIFCAKDSPRVTAELRLGEQDFSVNGFCGRRPTVFAAGVKLIRRLDNGDVNSPYIIGLVEEVKPGPPRKVLCRWFNHTIDILPMRQAAGVRLQFITLPQRLYCRLFDTSDCSDYKEHTKIVALRVSETKLLCAMDTRHFYDAAVSLS